MVLSRSQTGTLFEMGLSNLTILLSGGELQLARQAVDEDDVDRILTRLGARRASFLQMKTRAAPAQRQILDLHFDPIANAASREDLYLVAGELLGGSPWVGPRFAMIPAAELPPPSRSGQVNVAVPLRPGTRSHWAPFVHDRADLATVLSHELDGGPAYPFGKRRRPFSARAAGHLIETEVAAHAIFHGEGRLDLWGPLIDDFGEDFAATGRDRGVDVRLQPKGTVGGDGAIDVRVHKSTFRVDDFDYLVFGHYDPALPALTPWVFVFRADEFPQRATKRGDYMRFQARPDPKSAGKWLPWLYGVEELAGVLETALALRSARGASAVLPSTRAEVASARRELRAAAVRSRTARTRHAAASR